jgi:glutamate synthase domain-containing protein 1
MDRVRVLTSRSDGVKHELPSGTVVTSFADGSQIQEKGNGTLLCVMSDGLKVQQTPDGTTISAFADGSRITQVREVRELHPPRVLRSRHH